MGNILQKLDAAGRTEAVVWAGERGLLADAWDADSLAASGGLSVTAGHLGWLPVGIHRSDLRVSTVDKRCCFRYTGISHWDIR